jgi:hypothetical protein
MPISQQQQQMGMCPGHMLAGGRPRTREVVCGPDHSNPGGMPLTSRRWVWAPVRGLGARVAAAVQETSWRGARGGGKSRPRPKAAAAAGSQQPQRGTSSSRASASSQCLADKLLLL